MELAFFSLHVSRAQRLAPARTRTQLVQLRAQCTDHWTTGQSCGVGLPAVQLTTHVKSSTLCGHTVVWLYIQIFSAWWVTTILYNYGATEPYRMLKNYSFREKSLCSGCLKKLICGQTLIGDIILMLMATLLMKNMSQST